MARNILVTGANGWLGKAMVRHFLSRKDNVLATSRNSISSRAEEGFYKIEGLDLTDQSDVGTLVEEVDKAFEGRFSIVACHGYFPGFSSLGDYNEDQIRQVFEANLLSVFRVVNQSLPIMVERGGGAILVFSSNSVKGAFPLMSAFDSAKAGLENLVRSIANEFSGHGVTANAIALSTLQTETERILKPYGDYKHWLPVDDICYVVEKLLSDSLSIVNGNVVSVWNHSDSYFGDSYFNRIRQK